jgi:hypothetical protein
MANDRKIQFATQVIPKIEAQQAATAKSLEEYDLSKAAYQYNKTHTSINKSLGGNGYIDINSTQAGDSWTSMTHPLAFDLTWQLQDTLWTDAGTTWDTGAEGDIAVSSSLVQLVSDTSTLAFCYIKNTGANTVKITLEYGAGSPTYPFKLPAAGSVQFKGYSTNLAINKIGVVRVSSDSTIEYVIAKA